MAEKIKKAFPCTQYQLYIICLVGWKNYLENLPSFTRFRAIYTSDYGKDAIAAVTAAQNMKNLQERNQMKSAIRNQASSATLTFCKDFKTLKQYIIAAYKGQERKTSLTAAGSAFYTKARRGDWEALSTLLQSSASFINLKKDELMANDNMPVDFLKKFLKDASVSSDFIVSYREVAVNKKEATANKMEANNAIYETLKNMLANAQDIFSSQISLKEKFTFINLYEAAKSQTPASIKGYITVNGQPLAGALIKVQKTDLWTLTDKEGRFSIRLAANAYMIEVSKDGFTTLYEGVILKAGKARHLNLELQPVSQSLQANDQQPEAQAV